MARSGGTFSSEFVNFPRGCKASKFWVGGYGALVRLWWLACGLVAVFAGGKVEEVRTVILNRELLSVAVLGGQ